ncbi:hypothetical protein PR048_026816 [Dryococelus australis]|uniref:Uncharacterized protein n=1 Tax=Dryococelus australis TaxID=614101 RepID=A0ABQ9GMD2_9NEOP|nr:hypothetical protein PR048_026816 [Dryococelus australis]
MPVMTKWNSWFVSVKYIAEYLEDLMQLFSQDDEGGSTVTYFKNLTSDAISVIKCSSVFLVEHFTNTTDAMVEFEGSKYPFINKVYTIWSGLQNSFTLVSKRILDPVKVFILHTSRLFNSQNITAKSVDAIVESAKKIPQGWETPTTTTTTVFGRVFDFLESNRSRVE